MKVFRTQDFVPKDNTIGIFRAHGGVPAGPHAHEFIEIIYVLAGTALERIDGREYRVGRGDMIFINYGAEHDFEASDGFDYFNICFSPSLLGDSLITRENALALLSLTAFDELRGDGSGGVISFSGEERREIEHILQAMLSEHHAGLAFGGRVMENYMNVLITKMLRKTEMGVEVYGGSGFWDEMSSYILENLDSELTLTALAKKCFYNPSYFSRAFHARFGVSLTEYVAKRRIESAIVLLAENTLTVEEIARSVGFADRSAFYHAFSKYMGTTPSEYRTNLQRRQ